MAPLEYEVREDLSFHPSMDYGRGHHKSARALPEEGPAFAYTAENRATLEEICARYPPERRKSAILAALYLAQQQQGYLTRNAMRHVAEVIGCTPADVEDVVSYYTMFFTRPVGKLRAAGVPHAVVRADGRRAGDRGAVEGARHQARRDRRGRRVHAARSRMPGRLRRRRSSASTITGTSAISSAESIRRSEYRQALPKSCA